MIFFKVSTIYLNIVHLQQWLNQYKFREHILIIHKVSFGQNFGRARVGSHHCILQYIRYVLYPRKGHYQNSSIIEGLVDLYTSIESSLRILINISLRNLLLTLSNVSTKRLAIFNSSTDNRWVREGHFAQSRDDILFMCDHEWKLYIFIVYIIYYDNS